MSRPPLAEEAAGAADTGPRPGLWRNRDFNLLWTGQSLSDLGGAMVDLALPCWCCSRPGPRRGPGSSAPPGSSPPWCADCRPVSSPTGSTGAA